ncbi:MAG: ABC transporter permease [Burkholderiaceae bacterium]
MLAERLIASLQQRMAYVRDVRLTIRRVRPDEASPADRLRLVVAERAADGDAPGTAVLLRLDSPPDAGNGALLAIVGEAVAQLNLQLANAPQTIRVDYAVDQGPPQSSVAPGSAGYYVTGLAVLTMVSTALFGFSGPLIELRARGGLKLFRVMPVHRTAFLAGFALCRVSILVVFSLVFLIAGLAVLAGMPLRGAVDWTLVGVLVVAGAVAFMAAGLALAGVIVNNTVATAVINLLNLPIMFLSDLFIPLALMPDSIQTVARWSPVYQLAVAIRMAVVGDAVPAYSVLSLAALAVVSIAVAAATFRWTVRR